MVNDLNFSEKFKLFFKANPHDWRMIRRGSRPKESHAIDLTPYEERAWMKYLTDKGLKHRLGTWQMMLARGVSVMVPCADPHMFDMEYVPAAELPRDEVAESVVRARLFSLSRALGDDLRHKGAAAFGPGRRSKPWREPPGPVGEPPLPKPLPKLSDEAKALYKPASNPPETLADVEGCLR